MFEKQRFGYYRITVEQIYKARYDTIEGVKVRKEA